MIQLKGFRRKVSIEALPRHIPAEKQETPQLNKFSIAFVVSFSSLFKVKLNNLSLHPTPQYLVLSLNYFVEG
jgi:hypothetical protein